VELAHVDPATLDKKANASLIYEPKTTIYLVPEAARKLSMAMVH
jgi:hypothetical protein